MRELQAKKSSGDPPELLCSARLSGERFQFCKPGGVLLVGNGHTPLVNLSVRKPLS